MINQLYSNFCIFYNSAAIGGGMIVAKLTAELDIGVSGTADTCRGGERMNGSG
jgi:hypothetical protein